MMQISHNKHIFFLVCVVVGWYGDSSAGRKAKPVGVQVVVKRVVDGDTIAVQFPEPTHRKRLTRNDLDIRALYRVYQESFIRMRGINTPEKKTKDDELKSIAPILDTMAAEATEYMKQRCPESVYVTALSKGAFGRILAHVCTHTGNNVAAELKQKALATNYYRSKKKRIEAQWDLAREWVTRYEELHPDGKELPERLKSVAIEQGLMS